MNASPSLHSGLLRTGDLLPKYGIEADLVFISSGSLNVQALVGNTVQFAAGGPAALEARLRWPKLVTIANRLTLLASIW